MSNEYLIPEKFLNEIEKFLNVDKKQFLTIRFKKQASPELKQWLEERNIPQNFLLYIYKNRLTKIVIPTCPTCGKELSFKQIMWGNKFCSLKCGSLNSETQKKTKQTNLKKYGVEHTSQVKEVREKAKQTCLEKYGVENPAQSKEIQEKFKQTCLEKYGVENPNQCKEIREKIKNTNLEKYGVEHPLQSKKVQEKTKQTCLEKYGVEFATQTEEVKEKIKQTCLEKYGNSRTFYGKIVHKKVLATRRTKHWYIFCSLLKERNITPLFSKEEYINDTGRKFRCLACGEEFVSEGANNYMLQHKNKDGTYTTLIPHAIFCPHCFKAPYSQKEKEVLEFVKRIYKGEILENHKGLFPNKQMELDIYLPSLNLGIEFDGEYWHSLEGAKEKDERKNQLCEEKGIRLLRIKESEWDTNRTQVENQIKEFLGIK